MSTEYRSYTTIEVARRLGVSLQTVQRWVDSGRLKAWKTLGGHRRIEADSAEALFRSQSEVNVQEATPLPAPVPRGPIRVLVVDDDPLDLELTVALVSEALPQAAIETATDGFQALVSVGRNLPDILVTDVNMPHMDGFEMIRSLAEVSGVRPATILAVSSLSPSDLAARGRAFADVQFMSKPVEPARFAAALRLAADLASA